MKKKNLKQLSKEWDAKLKKSGFVDIEKTLNGERVLISSPNPYRETNVEGAEAKREYYTQLNRKALSCDTYRNCIDGMIMLWYSEGHKISEICVRLYELGTPKYRGTIRSIIKRYEIKWGL